MRPRVWFAGAILLTMTASGRGAAQEPGQTGPMKPPPAKREIKRIPLEAAPEAPPIPVEEIIQRFTARESEFKRARDRATYRQTVRVQEFEEDGTAGGEYVVSSEITPGADGVRTARVVNETASTLRRASFAPEDLDDLARLPAFVLTRESLQKYELTYAGVQPVDELTTYAFRVRPKTLERRTRYFEGVVWVDNRDLEIVRTYGKFVSEVEQPEEVLFKLFETYRDSVEGKLRFPIYMRSDDVVKSKKGEARVRLTVRWTDFKVPPQ